MIDKRLPTATGEKDWMPDKGRTATKVNDHLASKVSDLWSSRQGIVAATALAAVVAILVSIVAWRLTSAARWGAPLCSMGDCTQELAIIKTVVDHGWFTSNPDIGAPFGAKLYDFPIPEPTTAILLHSIALFSASVWLIFNVYYVLGYGLAAAAACWALRKLGVTLSLSVAGGIAFAILPYHFLRIMHLQLSSYFPVAIYCCYAMRLAVHKSDPLVEPAKLGWMAILLIAIAAGGGVYYAFFGCIFIAAGALIGSVRCSEVTPIRVGLSYLGVIILVIVFSLAPNYWYHFVQGNNPLVANRVVSDAQRYGLQIIEMLLPTTGHRFSWADAFTQTYYGKALLINENATSALGVLGSVGFFAALATLLFGAWRRLPALATTGAMISIGVLYATIGGFGALVAYLLIPDIRGLNRISVFIAFFSLFALLWLATTLFRRHRSRLMVVAASLAVVVVAFADQIPTHAMPNSEAAAMRVANFQRAGTEFSRLQSVLPRGTAIFELPYMFYPEAPPHDGIWSYDLFLPYLYTHGLRWSFGGVHGRPSGRWSEHVSHLTGSPLADALVSFGFGAVYVDGAGYQDHGAAINKELTSLFGPPMWRFESRSVYRVASSSGTKNYAIASYGNGWFPEEPAAANERKVVWAWSRGNATLDVFNPSQSTVPLALRFELGTVDPRHVVIDYRGRTLGEFWLKSTSNLAVTLRIEAVAGISHIRLSTNVPAQRPGNGDLRKLAFRVMNLEVVRSKPESVASDTLGSAANAK